MGYLGWKAKVATSCRNAFMTNIVLARGSSAAPEKRSVFRSGGFFRFNISVDFPATQLFLYAKDEKLRRSLFIFRPSETVVNIIKQFYSYLSNKKKRSWRIVFLLEIMHLSCLLFLLNETFDGHRCSYE